MEQQKLEIITINKKILAKATIIFSFIVVGTLTIINYVNQTYPLLYADYFTVGMNAIFTTYFIAFRNDLFTAAKFCIAITVIGVILVILVEQGQNGSLFWPSITSFFVISFFGHRTGTVIASIFYAIILGYMFTQIDDTISLKGYVRFGLASIALTSITCYYEYLIDRSQRALARSNEQLQTQNDELQQAVAQVKELTGLLPICASCHSIRDDNGYWNQIESYISEHTEATFSHSLCPKCAQKLYPELCEESKPSGIENQSSSLN